MTSGRTISKNPAEGIQPDGAMQSEETRSRAIHTLDGTVVILLSRLNTAYWPWGWHRTALGSWLPQNAPGLRFVKSLGSGLGGGFGLVPSPSHQAMFYVFDSDEAARHFTDESVLVARYRQRSAELFIATLTRASIRASAAAAFWRHAPAAQDSLIDAPGCELAIGMGEAPLLRQATFSLWQTTSAMDAYARTGAHLQAIRAAWKHEFFSESMFVRFLPVRLQGQWKGRSYD